MFWFVGVDGRELSFSSILAFFILSCFIVAVVTNYSPRFCSRVVPLLWVFISNSGLHVVGDPFPGCLGSNHLVLHSVSVIRRLKLCKAVGTFACHDSHVVLFLSLCRCCRLVSSVIRSVGAVGCGFLAWQGSLLALFVFLGSRFGVFPRSLVRISACSRQCLFTQVVSVNRVPG